ncbi:MAG: helix-turn-helix domain-containing protein [Gammaproteobacteria bacterium]
MPQSAQQTDDLYFQMFGLTARPPQTLNKALQDAIESMHRTLYAPSSGELTSSELALLEQAGADVEEHPDRDDPMMAYATDFGAILATSLSAAQAAKRLGGVTPVRVRQMIREGILYAIRIESRWKIPVFQFEDEGLVPNIGVVNAVLPKTLDAVSVLRWFTTPDPELETSAGDVLSPLDWLKVGMDPAPVVRIARDL